MNWTEYPGIVSLVLDKVENEDIKYLRVDRYDGFLFDDFEISKSYNIETRVDVAGKFAYEILRNYDNFNYRLFFTNKYGYLFCRFFNTFEQIFENPDHINGLTRKYIDEAFSKRLITFKQYNTYIKNHGDK